MLATSLRPFSQLAGVHETKLWSSPNRQNCLATCLTSVSRPNGLSRFNLQVSAGRARRAKALDLERLHLVAMPHIDKELIDTFVMDMKQWGNSAKEEANSRHIGCHLEVSRSIGISKSLSRSFTIQALWHTDAIERLIIYKKGV